MGRYVGNVSDGKGGYSSNQTTVGSYNANAWELYDMHGNVSERCLNWYNSSLAEGMGNGIDPKGPSSSSIGRVVRGGNCYEYASYCTSSYREGKLASNADYSIGFRVSCSLSSEPETICFGERGSVAIDLSTGTRVANLIERIHYSSLWVDGAAPDDVVVMEINGETFKSVMGRGHMVWYPSSNGTYVVTHRVKSGNKQIGETQMVTFIVDRLGLLATQTTEIPVPYAWLRQCYVNIPDDYDAYEATSKATALNGHKVWECYVVGLDPMIPTDNFKITSFRLTTDGTPDLEHIVFYPPQSRWNVLGAQPVIKGVAALGSDWQTVTDENKAALRFFKVEVSMP